MWLPTMWLPTRQRSVRGSFATAFAACFIAATFLAATSATAQTSAASPDDSLPVPLTEYEIEQLCRTGSSDAASLEEVEADVAEQLTSLSQRLDITTLEQCRQLPGELSPLLDRLAMAYQSLCAATSTPVPSALATLTRDVRRQLSRLEASQLSLARCQDTTRELRALLHGQSETILSTCEASPQDAAFSACGVASPNAELQAAARTLCGAHDSRAVFPWQEADQITACLIQQRARSPRQPAPRSSRSAISTDRALAAPSLQSGILRGAADFLVERAEQELSLFAMQMVASQLCKAGSVSGRLLKRSCLLLDPQSEDGGALGATPSAIRYALRADLDDLPDFLSVELRATQPELSCATAIAWGFTEEAMTGSEIVALLSDMDPIFALPAVRASCEQAPEIRRRVTDLTLALRDIRFASGIDVPGLVREGHLDYVVSRTQRKLTRDDGLNELGTVVKEVLRRSRELDRMVRSLDIETSRRGRAEIVIAGLRTIEPILSYAGQDPKDPDWVNRVNGVIQFVTQLGNREYSAAVVTTARLYEISGQSNANTQNLLGLAATLADADSADAVRAGFRDAALPLQSWRRKNAERWGATLTSMVGFHPALEVVLEEATQAQSVSAGPSIAPALMVGVDWHRGFGGSRAGVLFNLLDLGALGSLRLDDPEVSTSSETEEAASVQEEPDVRIEQVFAPGLYPYFGIGPFDLGVGASFVPSLRSATNPVGEQKALDVLRFGVLISVDVSILPIY